MILKKTKGNLMQIVDDTSLFQSHSIQGLKENNGRGARKNMLRKLYIILTILASVFSLYVITCRGDGLEGIRKRKTAVVSTNNEQSISSKTIPNVEKVKHDPKVTEISNINNNSQIIEKYGNEEGKLFEFRISNLEGDSTKEGTVIIRTKPSWAPLGVKRFEELISTQFYNDCRFFRVVPNFIVQFGINGNPEVQKRWSTKPLKDDPVKMTNKRGTVTFATSGKNTRTTQLFINTGEKNAYLDKEGFSPFGEVVEGMDVIDRIYAGYKQLPNQTQIRSIGNSYLQDNFPKLSFITTATIIEK